MIYKNKNFIKRDYKCSNVVFCETEKALNESWIKSTKKEMIKMNVKPLFVENKIKYYGYL